MSANNFTQIHNKPTRENNLLDLVFVSNPTLVKSSINVPGISDHDNNYGYGHQNPVQQNPSQEVLHLQ